MWFCLYVLIRPVDRKEFEQRTFPHAYDVLVYTDESHYYAKDARGNVICVDSSTGCLQEGINHGKHIYVKGIFNISNPVNVVSGRTVYIDGYISSVQITDQLAHSIEIIGIGYGSSNGHIGNLYMDNNPFKITFRNLYINNATIRFGGHILFDSCSFTYVNLNGYDFNRPAYWITFLRSWIQNPNGVGIDINNALHILFISSVINYNKGIGVNIYGNGGHYIKFINSDIESNQTGISVTNGDVVLEETHFYDNADYAIYMGTNSEVVIKDGSDVRGTRSGMDIKIDFTSSVLIIDRTSRIGNIVGLNNLGYFKSENPSYLSRNMGQAMIPANTTRVTVSHGLAKAPTKVLITPLASPPGKLWVENITATSFDIVTDTAPTVDLNVAWYAEC